MDKQSEQSFVSDAKGLAKWFSVKVEIRLFGQLVWSKQWPPEQ